MPYVLVVLFLVPATVGHPSGGKVTLTRIDHMDSIRFEDEQACKDAMAWLQARMEAWKLRPVGPYAGPDANNVRMECMPAKSAR
jgi:hypothetical protein